MNRIFVVNKPPFISSNSYLSKIKRKYKRKKAGFSGTLDPFACGCLIVAFGQYTKLFRYLKKTPKKYRATIWLGASSSSLDIENMISIEDEKRVDIDALKSVLESLVGELEYTPPKFCAKKIDGKRAYELARSDEEFELKKSKMSIFSIELINYSHPFITFEATVSEGAYIRSLAQIISSKLNVTSTLSYLERLNEGEFFYDREKALNPTDFLTLEKNTYIGEKEWFELGKKLSLEYFEKKSDGEYLIEFDRFFAIISIEGDKVSYILNKMALEV
jgi:tRNA pseudouridine55 synthase